MAKANRELVVINSAMLPETLSNTVSFGAFRTLINRFFSIRGHWRRGGHGLLLQQRGLRGRGGGRRVLQKTSGWSSKLSSMMMDHILVIVVSLRHMNISGVHIGKDLSTIRARHNT